MTRLALGICVALALATGIAYGKTPAQGRAKVAIVRGLADHDPLKVSHAQAVSCFDAYTDGSRWAVVTASGSTFRQHPRWFRGRGRCVIQILVNHRFEVWQPDTTILHKAFDHRWYVAISFDEVSTAANLRQAGVPIPVYRNLTGEPVD
jgi:hypothetical protein